MEIKFAIIIFIISLSSLSNFESKHVGFSVDIIHRDSPLSPFYNSSLTPVEWLNNAFQRSAERVKYFTLALQSGSSPLIPSEGEYLMQFGIGTPPYSTLAIVDTGSDLTWTQCLPCKKCFTQKSPLFNPTSSSTYKVAPCCSKPCQTLKNSTCSNGACRYTYSYADNSYTRGALATETITLGSASLPGIIFGCGNDNGGTYGAASGIVGLGTGPISLISQTSSAIGSKFSFCLVSMSSQNTKPGKLNFGGNAIVSGSGVVSTPLIIRDTFYFLTLEGLTVGHERLEFYSSSSSPNGFAASGNGNIIIDSGTTWTLVPPDLYSRLESSVRLAVGAKPVPDPQRLFSLCYRSSDNITFPIITAHFTNADVKLNPVNTLLRTSTGLMCLAFAPINDIPIYGNVAQINFLVGYDLTKKTLSFKPTDCATV
ncbi:aspartic proteinase CDR1-like [Actinidia eriantha]|uniref:aspartic proteinase CDR1-like n=1 Tax=Actinidia eriantha TaxID=165200 RepID=UPI0025830947|nr:aspartic proteinase CDR1-like [Actinidia eriantha]